MPGAGKSTISRKLAQRLNMSFMDLDEEIEKGEELTIKEIFSNTGEDSFRKLESEYLTELLSSEGAYILASGGGTPCFYNNMELMLSKGTVFYLEAKVEDLLQRMTQVEKGTRPLFNEGELKDSVNKLFHQRHKIYEKAHYTIPADEHAIDAILGLLEEETDRKGH